MDVREITDKTQWEAFVSSCRERTFLQSWNWGEFQTKTRGNVWRLGFFQNGRQAGAAQIIKVQAKRGTFLLVPHGPVGEHDRNLVVRSLISELKRIARQEGASFARINPVWQRSQDTISLFKGFSLHRAPLQTHPEASWKLDISPSADELFKGMRKTTRYLIRKAQENPDIAISFTADIQDVGRFSELHNQVSERQQFIPFSREYLENEFLSFARDNQVALFWAKYKGEIAAG
ncbi:MAG: peptidoglycan bridge formation glycyltransferase FemA/FemB family protein [Candidatus Wildermuthbacteria bacterium]|nr:peptidoglycan bridge formation glycyltransferase FemA/FemB family protein [Candidatus Wildermuthbacteria bacterium]